MCELKIERLMMDAFASGCAGWIADALALLSQDPEASARWLDFIVYMAVAVSGGGDVLADEIVSCTGGNIYTPLSLVEELVGRRMLRTGSRIVYLAYAQKQYNLMLGTTVNVVRGRTQVDEATVTAIDNPPRT
jgi:hypothetical protein